MASDLRSRFVSLPPKQRGNFRRRLAGAERITDPRRRARAIASVTADLERLELAVQTAGAAAGSITYPAELPITEYREELLAAIGDHQVVVVAGETGSGKSTQLPKFCLELGRGVAGLIGHTQPRRIAARSIAERLAEELGTTVGDLVGYSVRFSDRVGERSLIKVMTDGILLAEIQRDRLLRRYDTIIVDEAHERSLNIDFLLGYLSSLLPRRPDLKVIITSATIDTQRFAAHFGGAPVIEVSGRSYPVEIRYRPSLDSDQPQAICDAVVELFEETRQDILVFCSGEREIRDARDALDELDLRLTEILPLYGRLSAAEQHRVFEAHTGRRIVLATNVAETSLTVPGVGAVIDAGTARISRYNRRTRVQRLPIEPISRASADQRAGRCGRLGPGICIRLYSEDDFEGRDEYTEPEIQRTSLASVILQMAALGLGDIEAFPFLDRPDTKAIRDGVALLEELGAVDPARQATGRWLTPMGRQLARLPLDPRLARMVLEADRTGCMRDVLVIAAALSIQDPRERPTGSEQKAAQSHARFRVDGSDFLGWLQLWSYLGDERRERTSSQFRSMCRDEFLNYRRVREWQDVHSQLRDAAGDLGLAMSNSESDTDTVHRTLLAGLLSHIGVKDPDSHEYRGSHGSRFSLGPGSVLFKKSPEHIMAAELVETTRLWAHSGAAIRTEWVEEVGAHLLKRTYSDPWWDAKRGAAVANETVTIYGLNLVPSRVIQYGRIDPGASRALFIQHCLVGGEWEAHHEFLDRNLERIDEVRAIEARERRSDLLVDDAAIFEFFDIRIPDNITTTRHFDRWWRDVRSEQPNLLDLSLGDLIDESVRPPDEEAFPSVWQHGDVAMPLDYRFDPHSESDGLTVEIPLGAIDRVDPDMFDWHIPGMREELIAALIRTLPKPIRKELVPVTDTARSVIDRLDPSSGGLLAALRRELSRVSGIEIPLTAFDVGKLPFHLRPGFRVVGAGGEVVAEGADLSSLRVELAEHARESVRHSAHPLERSDIRSWDFGELPTSVEIEGRGEAILAYPALHDDGESVSIRVLATRSNQHATHWAGVRRLVLLGLPSPGKLLRGLLTDALRPAFRSGPYESASEWAQDCLFASVDEIMAEGMPFDAVSFDALASRVREGLGEELTAVGRNSLAVFDVLRDVETAAARLPEIHAYAVSDVATQLNRLIYPGFITAVGAGRLLDVHRYLRAALWRLERVAENPDRDRSRMEKVLVLEGRHDELVETLPPSDGLAAIGWQLQELRVNLFAQGIGTRGSVSVKRVLSALSEVAIHG